jgi:predicted patatin/cPLA2 family phospholipase
MEAGMTHTPSLAPPGNYGGPKRSLVLAGGGMRVAYQAGALLAIAESGLCFHHADGTSGGTINLAMLLSGLSPAEMVTRWTTLDPRDFIGLMPWADYLRGPDLPAMGSADGIVNKVFPHLGIDLGRINDAAGIAGTFNLCNFSRKTVETMAHTNLTQDLLVAGISLPIFMPAVRRGDAFYTDAVWIKDANLMEAVRQGAEEIWVIWCIGNSNRYQDGAFRQYVHMIEMSANGALFQELDQIAAINARIAAGEAVDGRRRPIVLHLIRPDYPLPLDPDYTFGRIDGATLAALGYADGKRYLASRDPAGLPLTPEVTHMADETTGLSFRETMSGGFALGESDPEAGRRKGAAAGTELTLHATVMIQDLDRFLDEPNHPGTLAGSIAFAPLGGTLRGTAGVFNLFSPSGQAGLKYMVYELGFTHDGKPYYLAGRKEVRDDPAFDMWKQTTTLYTVLHEGADTSGKIIGAGVLSLGVADLIRMLGTVSTPGAPDAARSVASVARFGRFFLGQLWDSYGMHLGRG